MKKLKTKIIIPFLLILFLSIQIVSANFLTGFFTLQRQQTTYCHPNLIEFDNYSVRVDFLDLYNRDDTARLFTIQSVVIIESTNGRNLALGDRRGTPTSSIVLFQDTNLNNYIFKKSPTTGHYVLYNQNGQETINNKYIISFSVKHLFNELNELIVTSQDVVMITSRNNFELQNTSSCTKKVDGIAIWINNTKGLAFIRDKITNHYITYNK